MYCLYFLETFIKTFNPIFHWRGEVVEFSVPKNEKRNHEKYSKDTMDLAYDFSRRILKEVGGFIKGIVLFGSAARRRTKSNDIDILVVINDLDVQPSRELVQGYRTILRKVISDVSPKLHITTLRYTSFWEYVRAGDPVGLNILRDGVPILDNEFFMPLQQLLYSGRIRPSPEAIWSYYAKAPVTLNNAKAHLLQGAVDLYWAVIDASHAALMKVGTVPPSPEHVPEMLEEKLVKAGLLHKKYPGICHQFYILMKKITHREIKELSGAEFDKYEKLATDFVDEMKHIVDGK